MLQSLLIAVDLSPGFERVVERAALLPVNDDAQITLLHVVPKLLPRDARERAEHDAQQALGKAWKRVARAFPKRAAITLQVKTGSAETAITREAKAVHAELIVMGRGGGRAFRDVFLGSTAERVIRQAQRPVLVVRKPAKGPYSRPLFAVDNDAAVRAALAFGLDLLPTPRPRLSWVHAYAVPYEGLMYPSLSVEQGLEYRVHYQRKTHAEISALLASAAPEPLGFTPYVRHGSPRMVIPKVVTKTNADLLVLGTHAYTGVMHTFLGSVAGDVLRSVPSDVLMVPPHVPRSKRARTKSH